MFFFGGRAGQSSEPHLRVWVALCGAFSYVRRARHDGLDLQNLCADLSQGQNVPRGLMMSIRACREAFFRSLEGTTDFCLPGLDISCDWEPEAAKAEPESMPGAYFRPCLALFRPDFYSFSHHRALTGRPKV